MGSGASATLSERLTEDDVRSVCGDSYNFRFFQCLKGEDGLVDRDMFLTIAADRKEQEVALLFLSFCRGENVSMDNNTFVQFCRHGKLFSKKRFNRRHVDTKTQSCAKSDLSATLVFPMSYRSFRFSVIPIIAVISGHEVAELINRLARAELNHPASFHSQSSLGRFEPTPMLITTDGAASNGAEQTNPSSECESGASEEAASPGDQGDQPKAPEQQSSDIQHNKAILALQQAQRERLARNATRQRQELKKLASLTLEEKAANTFVISCEPEVEEAVKSLFLKFAPSGEMSEQDFVRFSYDTELIPYDSVKVDFTSRDARYIFQRTIAMFFDPVHNEHTEGVILGKRITYNVFRGHVLPAAAAKKGNMLITDLLRMLSAKDGVVRRMYQTDAGPTVVSLLDAKLVDKEIEAHAQEYEEHVM